MTTPSTPRFTRTTSGTLIVPASEGLSHHLFNLIVARKTEKLLKTRRAAALERHVDTMTLGRTYVVAGFDKRGNPREREIYLAPSSQPREYLRFKEGAKDALLRDHPVIYDRASVTKAPQKPYKYTPRESKAWGAIKVDTVAAYTGGPIQPQRFYDWNREITAAAKANKAVIVEEIEAITEFLADWPFGDEKGVLLHCRGMRGLSVSAARTQPFTQLVPELLVDTAPEIAPQYVETAITQVKGYRLGDRSAHGEDEDTGDGDLWD